MRHPHDLMYLCLFVAALLFLYNFQAIIAYDISVVDTTVNITRNLPIIDGLVINYGLPINLSEGTTFPVLCNVTIINYNGLGDLSKVNATFFRTNGTEVSGYGVIGEGDNNSRYHNSNCTYDSTQAAWTYAYNCTFNVTYYAFNGSWNCTVWANNSLNSPVNGTNSSLILPLYAINVTESIDYGDMAVFDTSSVRTLNVTNFGNMPINLTVYGFGGNDNATGGGLAFICPNGHGTNISIGNERWTLDGDVAWGNMIPLSSTADMVDNVTIPKQSSDEMQWNTSYYKLYVPPNPFGSCNGTIVYEAVLGGTN